MFTHSLRSFLFVSLLSSLLGTSALQAQQAGAVRVTQAVDTSVRVTLPGNTHPLARAEFDRGEAPSDLPMKRMLLVLKRSPEQESALLSLLDNQQDKHSPSYHHWVTPKEFGARFGPADSDVAAVTNWLKASGFQVAEVSAGRTVIEFSGTASQVQAAFHTSIHKFAVNGKDHWANANDPQIPAALAPVVTGVHTLHNFLKQPQISQMKEVAATFTKSPVPQVTFPSPLTHALGPQDYAKIYNITPAYTAGINGTGITIAVVARSEFNTGDLSSFYGDFGISRSFPQFIFNGDTPKNLGGNEEGEAILDATWSSVLAPGAQVDFVVSASTNTTDGVDLSELYIVDHNLADVMTESFGSCEFLHSAAEDNLVGNLAEQAAAEGITYTVSTGDSGAEGCDRPSSPAATHPVSANLLSATPFNVAVGGTMFNEGTQPTKYWGSAAPLAETALSYIPENVWNESCSSAQCGTSANLAAGGGGVSGFFAKPSWQSGVTGIPNDGFRDQPDVSLTSAFHDPYLVCFQNSCSGGRIFFFSGTSAAAPSFAAIMALVDQKAALVNPQLGPRQGQANYVLYRLAAADIAAGKKCNASGTTLPASTCTFNDVTVGNNAVPGEAGFGTASAKYQSTVGYDLATGLGSVNVSNLVANWASVTFTPSTTTLTLSPTTIIHGASVNVHVNVTPNTATGDVSLGNGDAPGFIDKFTLSGGSVVATTNLLPGGTYHVVAHYAGDKTLAASDSSTPGVAVIVSREGSTTLLSMVGVDSTGSTFPYTSEPYGTPAYLRADVAGVSLHGTPNGSVTFLANGANFLSNTFSLNSEGTAATAQGAFTLPAGAQSIMANYGSDSSFTASSSAPVNVTVTKGPTAAAVVSSSGAVPVGTTVTLTATLNTNSVGLAPGGTLSFLSGGVLIATAGNPAVVTGTNGSGNVQPTPPLFTVAVAGASLTTTLPSGTDSITAQYNGDANYTGSTSSPVTVNVAADFDFTPATSAVTVTRGSAGTAMLTITGHTGYNSKINFIATSCTGLPAESTCSFSPASVMGSGSTTVTIKTTAPKTASLSPLNWWATSSGGIFAGLFLLGTGSRRRRWGRSLSLLAFAFLITMTITMTACGGGSSGGGPPPDPGTPLGTFNVTVHAADSAGVISHTSIITLKVQ